MCSKEVLKNQSMRFNLIFKGISEDSSETWEDTSQLATDFVTENLLFWQNGYPDKKSLTGKWYRFAEREKK